MVMASGTHLTPGQSYSVGDAHAGKGERKKVLFIQSWRSTESTPQDQWSDRFHKQITLIPSDSA